MSDQRYVLQYPKVMPKDGEFGDDAEVYEEQYSEAFVSNASGYPAPVKDLQTATWFDSPDHAKEVKGEQKHFKVQPLNLEVGKREPLKKEEKVEPPKTEEKSAGSSARQSE